MFRISLNLKTIKTVFKKKWRRKLPYHNALVHKCSMCILTNVRLRSHFSIQFKIFKNTEVSCLITIIISIFFV